MSMSVLESAGRGGRAAPLCPASFVLCFLFSLLLLCPALVASASSSVDEWSSEELADQWPALMSDLASSSEHEARHQEFLFAAAATGDGESTASAEPVEENQSSLAACGPQLMRVTRKAKSSFHPWVGLGSTQGLAVAGVQGAFLSVRCGCAAYLFDVSALATPGDFYLSHSQIGAGALALGQADGVSAISIDGRQHLQWQPALSSFPTTVYYQWATASSEGGTIHVQPCINVAAETSLPFQLTRSSLTVSVGQSIPPLFPSGLFGPYSMSTEQEQKLAGIGLTLDADSGVIKGTVRAMLSPAARRRLLSSEEETFTINGNNTSASFNLTVCPSTSYGQDCVCAFNSTANAANTITFRPRVDAAASGLSIQDNVPALLLRFLLPGYFHGVGLSLPQCGGHSVPLSAAESATDPCLVQYSARIEYGSGCRFLIDSVSQPGMVFWTTYTTVTARYTDNSTQWNGAPLERTLAQPMAVQIRLQTAYSLVTSSVNITSYNNASCHDSSVCVHGTCSDLQCLCEPGYTGLHCEYNVDECSDAYQSSYGPSCSGPGAICADTDGSYECSCEPGFFGAGNSSAPCTDIDECLSAGSAGYCDSASHCNNTAGNFTCACPSFGWTGSAWYDTDPCVPVDACAIDNGGCTTADGVAANVSTCMSTGPGTRACSCAGVGYSLNADNVTCDDTARCSREPLVCFGDGVQCASGTNDYACSCPPSYGGNGTSAAPCTVPPSCSPYPCVDAHSLNGTHTVCMETELSYNCSCPAGFNGTGSAQDPCTDVDECTLGTHSCDSAAHCHNTIGSFYCACLSGVGFVGAATASDPCVCPAGQTLVSGAGMPACRWTDICASAPAETACYNGSTCVATQPGNYSCACPQHFSGDGKVPDGCQPIDQCAELQPCDSTNGICSNVAPGQYQCTCQTGYELMQDNNCTLIDECTPNPCFGAQAQCHNADPSPGRYSCSCPPYHSGDGLLSSPCVGLEPQLQVAVSSFLLHFDAALSSLGYLRFTGEIVLNSLVNYPYVLQLSSSVTPLVSGQGTNASSGVRFDTQVAPECSTLPAGSVCAQQVAIQLSIINACALQSDYDVAVEVACNSQAGSNCTVPAMHQQQSLRFSVAHGDLCGAVLFDGQAVSLEGIRMLTVDAARINTAAPDLATAGAASLPFNASIALLATAGSIRLQLDSVRYSAVRVTSVANPSGTALVTDDLPADGLARLISSGAQLSNGRSTAWSLLAVNNTESIPPGGAPVLLTYTATLLVDHHVQGLMGVSEEEPAKGAAVARITRKTHGMHLMAAAGQPNQHLPHQISSEAERTGGRHTARTLLFVPVTYQASIFIMPPSAGDVQPGGGGGGTNGDANGDDGDSSRSGAATSSVTSSPLFLYGVIGFLLLLLLLVVLCLISKRRREVQQKSRVLPLSDAAISAASGKEEAVSVTLVKQANSHLIPLHTRSASKYSEGSGGLSMEVQPEADAAPLSGRVPAAAWSHQAETASLSEKLPPVDPLCPSVESAATGNASTIAPAHPRRLVPLPNVARGPPIYQRHRVQLSLHGERALSSCDVLV